ncbi:hypothetical protein KP509_37G004100 [Ceratopteris richardii]|uniref:Arb2 domain-containing protein n=1 Tax=Ceratopteris richardii TaxID=49495 RepID=A0A8T2Q668_CERRI|nr:hypothetical protein KP509_37G004100 [Ceratopteris richardii]
MEALEHLSYHFNEDLELRHTETGEVFKFIDQNHYEKLADAVAHYIQEIMIKDYDMMKLELPLAEHLREDYEHYDEEKYGFARCPIFVSSNYKQADVVLILLCGTGRVASGQWARKLCINDSLKTGSVLPFLEWAKQHSFAVMVLNPNTNYIEPVEGSRIFIPFNDSAEAHVNYVWRAVCQNLPANHFILVAHSYGGISTCNLLMTQGKEVLRRLRCVAFTDSINSNEMLSEEGKEFLAAHCVNWASSSTSLDTVISMPRERNSMESGKGRKRSKMDFFERLRMRGSLCKVVSAGTQIHEETTMSAYTSICKFFIEQLKSLGIDVCAIPRSCEYVANRDS